MKRSLLVLIYVCLGFTAQGRYLEIMSYNVENLFDGEHIEGRNDWMYLPFSHPQKEKGCRSLQGSWIKKCLENDWTVEKLAKKIENLRYVIKDSRGKAPEILALTEVTNDKVLELLVEELGYDDYVLSKGKDVRGINVALMFKNTSGLKYLSSVDHEVKNTDKPTRNVLQVNFTLNSEKISVLVNHWPSQAAPAEVRVAVAKQVGDLVEQIRKKENIRKILVTGDFNTIPEDYPDPFDVFKSQMEHTLQDLGAMYMADRSISWKEKRQIPLGSYFYGGTMSWNHLDRFFVTAEFLGAKGAQVSHRDFKIHAPERSKGSTYFNPKAEYPVYKGDSRFGSKVTNTPRGFDGVEGASDHFPIVVGVRY